MENKGIDILVRCVATLAVWTAHGLAWIILAVLHMDGWQPCGSVAGTVFYLLMAASLLVFTVFCWRPAKTLRTLWARLLIVAVLAAWVLFVWLLPRGAAGCAGG